MTFDRKIYFDDVRQSLFNGSMSQQQVDGQEHILSVWEGIPAKFPDVELDIRWLAYMLATAYHETSTEMWPIEEYGKGAGQPYGEQDPETGQTYYGRGYCQTTWRENYARADAELGYTGANRCEWNASLQLDPEVAAATMFRGMYQGWFRSGQTLPRYFNATTDDPYGAREIVNGDKSVVPSWSDGVSIGNLISDYFEHFLDALEDAEIVEPPIPTTPDKEVLVAITIPLGVAVTVTINGEILESN